MPNKLKIPSYKNLAALFFLILGCAAYRPISERGMSDPEERHSYIVNNGGFFSHQVRKAFRERRLAQGMSKEIVYVLFGEPDEKQNDSIWVYRIRDGEAAGGMVFQGDSLISATGVFEF